MDFAVYHLEKGNSSSGGIGNHIDRTAGAEHTFRHADTSKTHMNKSFTVADNRQNMTLSNAINDRIEKGYKGKRKIRTDAVKYCTHILTGSHDKMKEIFSDSKTANDWVKANFEFMKEEFGADNIVRFTVHLDEKTPHIHAVTIPLTEDGRLSAREVVGNKSKMQKRQDRYADKMKSFGLERGVKNTGIKHEDATEYYKRIKTNNVDTDLESYKKKGVLKKGLDESKVKEALTSANVSIIEKSQKLENVEKRLEAALSNVKNEIKRNDDTAKILEKVLTDKEYGKKYLDTLYEAQKDNLLYYAKSLYPEKNFTTDINKDLRKYFNKVVDYTAKQKGISPTLLKASAIQQSKEERAILVSQMVERLERFRTDETIKKSFRR